jgi:iodotyrosine deiodinase
MPDPVFQPLPDYQEYPVDEMKRRAAQFYADIRRRRTVRDFSDRPVPREILEDCVRAAATAPNGANMQPWHFVVVSDPAIKATIRSAAEKEEHDFYTSRAPREWLDALAPLGTDEHKPFLETAPYLIVIFAQNTRLLPLTHTPSPMGFLNEILGRPAHEKPFLILVTGFPAASAMVPRIEKKALEEIAEFV